MRKDTTRRAADCLPVDLITQVQEHFPEGGKLSFPSQGCSQRFLLSESERLAQNLEMTMRSLRLEPIKKLASDYEISTAGARKIIKKTLEMMREAIGDPPPGFDVTKTLDKSESVQQEGGRKVEYIDDEGETQCRA